MVTLRFIITRMNLLFALIPLLTFKKLFNLILAIFYFLIRSDHTVTHPPILVITITTNCNYNCVMCLKSSSRIKNLINYPNPLDMDYKILEKFIRKHKDYLCLVRLHGGEPLYYNHIGRLIDLLNELKTPFNMVTNGSLLTEKIREKLVNSYCLGIGISLDAATPELYKKIRKGGDINLITSNIAHLNNLKKKFKSNRPVLSASMCTFFFNAKEMRGLVRLCSQYKIPSISIGEGWDYKTNYIREEHLIKNHLELTRDCIIEAANEAKKLGIVLRTRFPSLSVKRFKEIPYHAGKIKPKNCLNLYAATWLLPTFDIVGCSSCTSAFGNIRETKFDKIWNSKNYDYAKARKIFRNGAVPSSCIDCIYTGGFFS